VNDMSLIKDLYNELLDIDKFQSDSGDKLCLLHNGLKCQQQQKTKTAFFITINLNHLPENIHNKIVLDCPI